jgi:hypothetical protein
VVASLFWRAAGQSPKLTVAAIDGASGCSAAAWPGQEGGDLFIGDKGACQRPKRPTATSRSKRRPREERTAGEAWNGPAVLWVLAGRPARGARRGQDFEAATVGAWPGEGAPRDADRGSNAEGGSAGADARATRRGVALWRRKISLCPCLTAISSQNLNRSAQSGE